jgi:hypothetical protein
MIKFGGERAAVQNPFIRYAQETGWTYLPSEDILRLRGGPERGLLRPVFVEKVQQLNPFVDAARAEDLARRIERVAPRIEGNLDAWEYLKGLKTIFVPEESRERNVRLVEAEPSKREQNAFHITDELRFANGTHRIRPDVAVRQRRARARGRDQVGLPAAGHRQGVGPTAPLVLPLSVVGNSTGIGDGELGIRPILEYPCDLLNTVLQCTRNPDAPRITHSVCHFAPVVAQSPLDMVVKPLKEGCHSCQTQASTPSTPSLS